MFRICLLAMAVTTMGVVHVGRCPGAEGPAPLTDQGDSGPGESSSRTGPRANRPPRKVVVGTTIFGPYGAYPGFDERLKALTALVDAMAAEASSRFPERGLDLAILPETTATSNRGTARERALPLRGKVQESYGALARRHKSYLLVPLDLAEEGPAGPFDSNAAVLFDRRGEVAGIYRKVHPVAYVNSNELERGITPGKAFPVFDCDFGRLGVQICWDIQFDDGWDALAKGGAEIVAWPTASPATATPAARALAHRYYVVSSTWRDNATVYEPTGLVGARAVPPSKVLVHQLDLSYAILGWSSFLRNGEALREKHGDKVGFHYEAREDVGLFWSNDPTTTIGQMVRALGGEDIDIQVERNRRIQDEAREKGLSSGLKVGPRKPEDRTSMEATPGSTIVTITSESGIGGATIERSGATWPDRLVVRLRLRGLESLTVQGGGISLTGSCPVAGTSLAPKPIREDHPGTPSDRDGTPALSIRAVGADGQPASAVPLNGGYFEVEVPHALMSNQVTKLGLEWIDFHR